MHEALTIPAFEQLGITIDGHVAVVELQAGPQNSMSLESLGALADAWDWLESQATVRAMVLCAQGKVFCAGVDFRSLIAPRADRSPEPLYRLGLRIANGRKPWVAAVQGAAVGGGMGLALLADQRIVSEHARFIASFAQLGFHAGFALTATLPHVVGAHVASRILLMAQPVGAEESVRIGLADELVAADRLRGAALARAQLIAAHAPRAVQDMRHTLRESLLAQMEAAVTRELACQLDHMHSKDFGEGISAMLARRPPQFTGN
jgi:enoyl-CoA hydratase/carnithine racemase